MFKKYTEESKLTLRQQKDLNKATINFLTWTVVYWFCLLGRLLIFYYKGG